MEMLVDVCGGIVVFWLFFIVGILLLLPVVAFLVLAIDYIITSF